MKIANRDTHDLTTQAVEFKANNIFAEKEGNAYVVYSYGHHFPMYVKNLISGQWFSNSDGYSVTTAKHKSQSRPRNVQFIEMDTSALKDLIYNLSK